MVMCVRLVLVVVFFRSVINSGYREIAMKLLRRRKMRFEVTCISERQLLSNIGYDTADQQVTRVHSPYPIEGIISYSGM